jgi:hypothetical protein
MVIVSGWEITESIYEIEDYILRVIVIDIGHRKDIYR